MGLILNPYSFGGGPTPVVAATNQGNSGTPPGNWSPPLPSGITAGDLLVVFVAARSGSGITFTGVTAGWNELFRTTGGGSLNQFACYWKIAAGGDTLNVTASTLAYWAGTSYRITGHHASANPECGTSATGNSTAPNPPNLTPSWGSANTLWIAAAAIDTTDAGATLPTNYGSLIKDYASTVPGPCAASGVRALQATSEDPGVWAFTNSAQWIAQTVAIRPA